MSTLYIDANGNVIFDASGFYLGDSSGFEPPPETDTELELVENPVISGTTLIYGDTLSCTTGVWSSNFPVFYAYQWQRYNPGVRGAGFENIFGENLSTHLVTNADVARQLRCLVTATNGYFIQTAESNTLTILGSRSSSGSKKHKISEIWPFTRSKIFPR